MRRVANFPSIKTLTSRLGLSPEAASILRNLHADGKSPRKVLNAAADFLGEPEVLDLPTGDGSPGLLYVNRGDPYDDTLIYDKLRGTWRVAGWGSVVEAQPRRFGE